MTYRALRRLDQRAADIVRAKQFDSCAELYAYAMKQQRKLCRALLRHGGML